MPSQEEYLDGLLKDVMQDNRGDNDPSGDFDGSPAIKNTYQVEDTASMSVEDIDRILSENTSSDKQSAASKVEEMKLEDLLGTQDDTELNSIKDMLNKAENNEAVDDEIVALIQKETAPGEEIEWEQLDSESDKNKTPKNDSDKKAAKKKNVKKKEDKKKDNEETEDTDRNNKKGFAEKIKSRLFGKKNKVQEDPDIIDESDNLEDAVVSVTENVTDTSDDKAEKSSETNTDKNAETITEINVDQNAENNIDALLSQEEGLLGDLTSLISDIDSIPDKDENVEPTKEKKKGFFARIMDFLTEEDEEKKPDQEIILSDENEEILKELDNEKKKKKGKKAAKKGKDSDDEEESDKKDKKSKKAQKQKKKKEPKLKEVVPPGKKLSKRRVFLIFMVCMTIGAVFIVLCSISVDYVDKKKASSAFYKGDYEACYQNLVGKHLNESQQVMFGKSESILRIRLWIREYEMLEEEGLHPEALDSLMQSVHDYPKLQSFSDQWNATSEVEMIYKDMLAILQEKYHLNEVQAKKIANEEDDLVYSKLVRAIAGGESFETAWKNVAEERLSDQEETSENTGRMSEEDLLPEEKEIDKTIFAD